MVTNKHPFLYGTIEYCPRNAIRAVLSHPDTENPISFLMATPDPNPALRPLLDLLPETRQIPL